LKPLALTAIALFPLLAFGRDDDRNWRLDEQETIRRSFDVASGSNPKRLLVDNVNGFIHVNGYGGSQIQVVVQKHIHADSNEAVAEAKRDIKVDMSQQGNFVRLYEDGPFRTPNDGLNYRGDRYYGYRVDFDYEIQVPYDTELDLKTLNDLIQVRKTTGDFEIRGLNGGIDMEDVSGSGQVRTLNGKVKVSFSKNPTRKTDFRTLNGSVDVYFQPGLDADLHFRRLNASIYTDFDVSALPVSQTSAESQNGKFVYRSNRSMAGRAGKGGPELTFDTLNGTIRLHSKTM
jgi:hypothetical protein